MIRWELNNEDVRIDTPFEEQVRMWGIGRAGRRRGNAINDGLEREKNDRRTKRKQGEEKVLSDGYGNK